MELAMHPSAVGRVFNKPVCRRGHDKRIVGVRSSSNQCAECARQRGTRHVHKRRAAAYGVPVVMVGKDADALRLPEAREALGLSREELARRIGVHRKTIWRLENGVTKGSPPTRKKIVDALAAVIGERRKQAEKVGI